MPTPRLIALCLLPVPTGCSEPPAVRLSLSEAVSTVVVVEVDGPSRPTVQVDGRTLPVDGAAGRWRAVVPGLAPEREVTVRVEADDQGLESTITTGEAPRWTQIFDQPLAVAEGWVATTVRAAGTTGGVIYALDGSPTWWWALPEDAPCLSSTCTSGGRARTEVPAPGRRGSG